MKSEKYLSNIELYFSEKIRDNYFEISGEELKHATKVMRHKKNDKIFATDGNGKIYSGKIIEIFKYYLRAETEQVYNYNNHLKNVTFCFPRLKSPDRFEFALEKCTELGITNFIVFNSKRSVTKGNKIERWNKILMAAMKQSLRSYLPKIVENNLEKIYNRPGEKIIFDQKSKKNLNSFYLNPDKEYFFIFGPEGGFTSEEISLSVKENIFQLASNRLRSETAIVSAAVILSVK